MAIFICLFLSGACALIYEIAWTRILSTTFGNTVFASSIVLASFMGGLALGSFLFGKYADRLAQKDLSSSDKKLLNLYVFLEAGVGLYCLLTPLIFQIIGQLYVATHSLLPYRLANVVHIILIASALALPTSFMGATLPVLSRYLIRNQQQTGKDVGILYAVNTFGAVSGVLIAGYLLPTVIGIKATIYMAATVNITISLVLLGITRISAYPPGVSVDTEFIDSMAATTPATQRSALNLALIAIGISGMASMIYEVSWTRTLSLILGSSTYAFSTMLLTFLLGIAIGSSISSQWLKKKRPSIALFGIVEVTIGFTAMLIMPVLGELPVLFVDLFAVFGKNFNFVLLLQFLICLTAMLVPTTLLGMTLPIATQLCTDNKILIGSSVGTTYSVNTIGCILGAIGTGFLLIPMIGVQKAIWIGILINSGMGIILLISQQKQAAFKVAYGLIILIPLALMWLGPEWHKQVMTSGLFLRAGHSFNVKEYLTQQINHEKLLYYKDGIHCTVSVEKIVSPASSGRGDITCNYGLRFEADKSPDERLYLAVNGKTDASTSKVDMVNQLLLGYLPVLLHPDPKNAFIIGLGSGVTAGAVARYPLIKEIDCAEIEPAVVEAARFFKQYNHNIHDDPRFRLIIGDGRHHLLTTNKKYDIIISEPSNPWIAGISSLFTREHYDLCKESLTADGIMVQWVHTYSMSPHDLKMIINTFKSVFPHMQVWNSSPVDIMLIGKDKEITINYQMLSERFTKFPRIKSDLEGISFNNPAALFSAYLLNGQEVRSLTALATLNTDDLPLLEFSAPKNLYRLTTDQNFNGILRYKTSQLPSLIDVKQKDFQGFGFHYNFGVSYFERMLFDQALESFLTAREYAPENHSVSIYLARLYLMRGLYLKTIKELDKFIQSHPAEPYAYYYRGKAYYKQDMLNEALRDFEKAVAISPDDTRFRVARDHLLIGIGKFALDQTSDALNQEKLDLHQMYLSSVYSSRGLDVKAIKMIDEILARNPSNAQAWYYRGKIHYNQQMLPEALQDFRQSLSLSPQNILSKMDMAFVLMDMQQYDAAVQHLEELVRRDNSWNPRLWEKLGRCYLNTGLYQKAAGIFRMALRMSPESHEIRIHLADAYVKIHSYNKAISLYLSVISQNFENHEIFVNLATAYHLSNQHQQARIYLDKALEHNPYLPEASAILMQLKESSS